MSEEFNETIYQLLRRYQDGDIENTMVCVGRLTPELTVVYDKIREESDKQLASAVETIRHYADKATWYRCDSHINLKYELEYHSAYNLSGENGYDKAAEWLRGNGYEN